MKETHWKRPWCWEKLGARGKGDNRGWDGWMASPTQQTWVWAVSECWWTGKPGVLQSMGLQRVRHEWATELNYAFNFSLAFSNVSFNKAILETTLMLGGIGGRRKRGQQRMRWLDGITNSMEWVWVNSGSWWWTGRPGVLWFMGSQRVRHNWMNWTELMWHYLSPLSGISVYISGL